MANNNETRFTYDGRDYMITANLLYGYEIEPPREEGGRPFYREDTARVFAVYHQWKQEQLEALSK